MSVLVVGSGPSHNNMNFIRDFKGIIISCDRTARDLVANNIIPDYITYSETQDDLFKVVLDFLPDSFANLKSTLVHRPSRGDHSLVGDRAKKLGLKAIVFDVESYVNNVGLYSIVFAVQSLGVKELHLIGLDHKGGRQYEGTLYPLDTFEDWLEAYRKFSYTKPDCNIIDHSNGRLGELLK